MMKDQLYDDFIERLRSESNIVNIISDYVPLRKKGKNYWGCCPFHQEKTPSFSVTPDKGFFYCFGCQSGGNIFNFLMKIESISFFEAVKLLADKMNIPLPQKEKSSQQVAKEKELSEIWRVNQLARDFFHSCLVKTSYGRPAKEYLQQRGVTDEIIETFKIGFAPPAWDKLSTAFLNRHISPDTLLKAGLAVTRSSGEGIYDRFRNRVMFPICDARGRIVGFGGRVIDGSQPKYLNSPETPVFNKRNILFGFDVAQKFIRECGQAIVVEGYMDVITARMFGINNAVASLGTAFTPEQAKMLLRYASEIIFAYDSDAAGQNATMRALSIVRGLGAAVKVVSIPDGKDPDEYLRKHGAAEFSLLVENALPLLAYQITQALEQNDYSSFEGKVAVVNQVVPVLANTENAVEANLHIARISQNLGIDESALRSEIAKFIAREKKDKNVKKGQTMNMVSISKEADSALIQAQRHIIRLMCDDKTIIPYVQAQVRIEDIQSEHHREIIRELFNSYDFGKDLQDVAPPMLMDEAANTELSHILLMEIPNNDISKLVDDCLRTIRLAHLNRLYEQHRLQADELERLGDSRFLQELAESQRIKHEINKLYCL